MTVIARKRKESKFEPVVNVKDIEHAAVDLCNSRVNGH